MNFLYAKIILYNVQKQNVIRFQTNIYNNTISYIY